MRASSCTARRSPWQTCSTSSSISESAGGGGGKMAGRSPVASAERGPLAGPAAAEGGAACREEGGGCDADVVLRATAPHAAGRHAADGAGLDVFAPVAPSGSARRAVME